MCGIFSRDKVRGNIRSLEVHKSMEILKAIMEKTHEHR